MKLEQYRMRLGELSNYRRALVENTSDPVAMCSRLWPDEVDKVKPSRDSCRPQKSHVSSHTPIRRHRTKPTTPDEELRESRTNPTSSDQSDRLLPPHNPSVVGSIPTGHTI